MVLVDGTVLVTVTARIDFIAVGEGLSICLRKYDKIGNKTMGKGSGLKYPFQRGHGRIDIRDRVSEVDCMYTRNIHV